MNNEYVKAISQIIGLVLSGSLIGNVVSGINNKKNSEQNFNKQLLKEREYTNSQLQERDEKIQELYKLYYGSEQTINILTSEKLALEWALKRKDEEIVLLKLEIVELKGGES